MPAEPAKNDIISLYSQHILALAASIPLTEPVEAPMAECRKRAPLCGSSVTVRLDYADDQVTRFSQDVRACALGQAAAAVLGKNVLGTSLSALKAARAELAALLSDAEAPVPHAPFADFEYLRPARDFANRHASICLALDATIDAIEGIAEA